MKSTIFILLYSAFFLVNNVHSLTGALNTVLGAYPAHALVLVNNLPFGGTIINANHVLTSCGIVLNAQHELVNANLISISVGSVTFTGGITHAVLAVFPHPEYNPWTLNHDVAVLRTVTNIAFNLNIPNPPVAPAILNERVLSDATGCFVVGFNAPTGVQPNPPLQALDQPIINRDAICNEFNVHNGQVLESMLCAGELIAGRGICPSTRGGGIYCNGNLTGIASSGFGCGSVNSPGIYAQVRNHLPWITEQLTRTQIPAAGPTPIPGFPAGASSASMIASTFLLCTAFLLTKI